jgi:hypothetical protein
LTKDGLTHRKKKGLTEAESLGQNRACEMGSGLFAVMGFHSRLARIEGPVKRLKGLPTAQSKSQEYGVGRPVRLRIERGKGIERAAGDNKQERSRPSHCPAVSAHLPAAPNSGAGRHCQMGAACPSHLPGICSKIPQLAVGLLN